MSAKQTLYSNFGLLLMSHAFMNVGRLFKKIELSEAIRYASGDPIEQWLHGLLCLDVTSSIPPINRLVVFQMYLYKGRIEEKL